MNPHPLTSNTTVIPQRPQPDNGCSSPDLPPTAPSSLTDSFVDHLPDTASRPPLRCHKPKGRHHHRPPLRRSPRRSMAPHWSFKPHPRSTQRRAPSPTTHGDTIPPDRRCAWPSCGAITTPLRRVGCCTTGRLFLGNRSPPRPRHVAPSSSSGRGNVVAQRLHPDARFCD